MKSVVELSLVEDALQQLKADCPDAYAKFELWVEHIETHGLASAEAIGWFRSHPIGSKGTLAVKLTKSVWRAEYLRSPDGRVVLVTEIHDDDY